jgi:predicted metal-dependent hydrolase
MGVLRDVRAFLDELKRDFPGLFPPPPKTRRSRRRRRAPRRSLPKAEKKAAEAWFAHRVGEWSEYMGVEAGKVRVRDMTSRWGSCSSKGNLTFNVRLLAAPGEIIDYVIVHELAHLREMNHSKRFWAIVAGAMPEYKALRKRLRAIGNDLLAQGAPSAPPAGAPAPAAQIPLPLTP